MVLLNKSEVSKSHRCTGIQDQAPWIPVGGNNPNKERSQESQRAWAGPLTTAALSDAWAYWGRWGWGCHCGEGGPVGSGHIQAGKSVCVFLLRSTRQSPDNCYSICFCRELVRPFQRLIHILTSRSKALRRLSRGLPVRQTG